MPRALRWTALAILALAAAAALHGSLADLRPKPAWRTVRGKVTSAGQPLLGATVRVRGEPEFAVTEATGAFSLRVKADGTGARITAAHPEHLIGGGSATGAELLLALTRRSGRDTPAYAWVDPRPDARRDGACGNCHAPVYDEWATSAHAQSAVNPRFWSVHDDLSAEYPEGRGVCYSCHVPSPEPDGALLADVRQPAESVHSQGIHCDFCHKISDVAVEPLGLNHGRFAMTLERPPPGEQLFFGPLDDVDRGEDVALPLYSESRYCGCHEGILFGTHAYSTYSEWQASPAAARGQDCQDCHMAPTGRMSNFAPGHGGMERHPGTLASHSLPGSQPEFVRRHVFLEIESVRTTAEGLEVTTHVQTDGVGHRTPTGHPWRHLVLSLEAHDAKGRPLALLQGPTLPAWAPPPAEVPPSGGPPRVSPPNTSSLPHPGTVYAKILQDEHGVQQIPYWRPNELVSDTRLNPNQPVRQRFLFQSPSGSAIVTARLFYRSFPQSFAAGKSWQDTEFLISACIWPTP